MIEQLQRFITSKSTARDLTIHECKLENIDLTGLHADGLNFTHVDMFHVDLGQAQWRNCEIRDSKLNEVSFKNATLRMCGWHNVDARNCNLSSITFENSEAQGCQFDNANFENSSLVDSDFSRASLRHVNLGNADVTGINLRGADLTDTNCDGVDFADADLRGADFSGAKLNMANLEGADLRGAIFDSDIENEAEPTTPMFSPQNQALADSVGPLVVSLLKEGADKDIFSEETEAKFMKELEELVTLSTAPDSPEQAHYDEIIAAVLDRAGGVGINELIETLHSDKDRPSESVSEMLKGLSKDLKLEENATTEDMLETLIKTMSK